MNALAQRIASRQHRGQAFREGLNDRDLQGEPRVFDACGKRPALAQQVPGAAREPVDGIEQRGGGRTGVELLHARACCRQHVEGDVDAVEVAVILSAILQVIDDLQRGAERIIGGPQRAALAVDVEHVAPDRHGGVGAVADQVVPITVAQLGHVHAEGGEQILRMARRELARRQLRAQCDRDRIVVVPAEQRRFELIHQCELFRRRQRGMVGNIVGGAHEFVEGEDRRAVARMNEPRRHGKVLVPVALARSCLGRSDHRDPDALACTRPFQLPPRPRTYW
jgi:hypothetical protein